MRRFNYTKEELLEYIGEFMFNFGFEFRLLGEYEIHLENHHCVLTFFTERYEESLVLILTDKKTGNKYGYHELFLMKGRPEIAELKKHKEILISKLLSAITLLEEHISAELNGDFSSLKNVT